MAAISSKRTSSSANGSRSWNRADQVVKSHGQAGRVVEPNGIWVYAITDSIDLTPLAQIRGVGGRRVRTVTAAGLTAVAEDVSLAEFGEEALRRNLEDLNWLETTARAHHELIAAMLTERGADFRSALRRISGHMEWGVKAYADRQPEAGNDSPGTPAAS